MILFRPQTTDSPQASLLAFALQVRGLDLSTGRYQVKIPYAVFQDIPSEAFKEIFSDLMLEIWPDFEKRVELLIVPGPIFSLGLDGGSPKPPPG